MIRRIFPALLALPVSCAAHSASYWYDFLSVEETHHNNALVEADMYKEADSLPARPVELAALALRAEVPSLNAPTIGQDRQWWTLTAEFEDGNFARCWVGAPSADVSPLLAELRRRPDVPARPVTPSLATGPVIAKRRRYGVDVRPTYEIKFDDFVTVQNQRFRVVHAMAILSGEQPMVAMSKFAAGQTQYGSVVCVHRGLGFRDTFDRLVSSLLQSLRPTTDRQT